MGQTVTCRPDTPGCSAPHTPVAGRFGAMSRPHFASRIGDRWNTGLSVVLRRRGWQARGVPPVGYGTPDGVGVLARVVLSRDPHQLPRTDADEPVRGWRQFVAAPAIGVP